ncbi:MAG: acetyltransferase-like isoleucine patch superfamily enzyme [Candidatus Omnitrophota bacterium]|jgi:acetyltransferase-like isoleucine patch superfamily enzyme
MAELDQNAQNILKDDGMSDLRKYALLASGSPSLLALIKYELITTLFSGVRGALGFILRKRMYRSLLGHLGGGAKIGCNVTFRGVKKISIGKNVFIDENVVIDARGDDARIVIHDNVLIARNTIIRSRGETLEIGTGTDIGNHCIISTDSQLKVGEHVLIAAYTYLCAGGNHRHEDPTQPIIQQGFNKLGGCSIGNGCWIGARTSVFDGVHIGEHTIVGAHSMVNKSLPAYSVCFGSPACVVKDRRAEHPDVG